VLPGLLIIGLGMGCIFAPSFSSATLGVEASEAGVASAMVNTSQQVGGSVGTALLSTLFASSAASYAMSHARVPGAANAALIHGYTTAFWWAAGFFAVGLVLAVIILPPGLKTATTTLRAVLARHAIGNCHHVEAPAGLAAGDAERREGDSDPALVS